MKLKEGTWHLRLVDWWGEHMLIDRPATLCSYFWFVVFGLTLLPVAGFIALGIVKLIDWCSKETEEPGLFRSWIKAKKDKVCPLMEYPE